MTIIENNQFVKLLEAGTFPKNNAQTFANVLNSIVGPDLQVIKPPFDKFLENFQKIFVRR